MDDVFDYVLTHNVCTEEDYEYKGRDGKCKDEKCNLNLGVVGRVNVREGSVDALLEAAAFSPLVVAIDASPMSFYHGGILEIKTQSLNHGVTLVGYELDVETPFVVIRNSWGPRWGEGGYVKVSLEHNGGITLAASYPDFGAAKPGLTKCKSGEEPDAAKNCLCSYGDECDKTGKDEKKKCKEECGCGEFGCCR